MEGNNNNPKAPRLQISNPAHLGSQSFPNIQPISTSRITSLSGLLDQSAQVFSHKAKQLDSYVNALAPTKADLIKDENVFATVQAMKEMAYSGKYNSNQLLNEVEKILPQAMTNVPEFYRDGAKKTILESTLQLSQHLDDQRLQQENKNLVAHQTEKFNNTVDQLSREANILNSDFTGIDLDALNELADSNLNLLDPIDRANLKDKALTKIGIAAYINPLLNTNQFDSPKARAEYMNDPNLVKILDDPNTAHIALDMLEKGALEQESRRKLLKTIDKYTDINLTTKLANKLDLEPDVSKQQEIWQAEYEEATTKGYVSYKKGLEKMGKERGFLGTTITQERKADLYRQGLSGNFDLTKVNNMFLSGKLTSVQERDALISGINARKAEFKLIDESFNQKVLAEFGVDLSNRVVQLSEIDELINQRISASTNAEDLSWVAKEATKGRAAINLRASGIQEGEDSDSSLQPYSGEEYSKAMDKLFKELQSKRIQRVQKASSGNTITKNSRYNSQVDDGK